MSKSKQIGLCLIATNKYKQFVQQFIDSANQFFCVNHDVTIVLFVNEILEVKSERIKVIQLGIPAYKFPQATLYRYKIFTDNLILLSQFDQIFYSDVDMTFVAAVGEEIFSETLTATIHPGFYKGGWGSPNNCPVSTSYLEEPYRKTYFAGGFQGGNATEYLKASDKLATNVLVDECNGVMAEWHDETHWNKYINTYEGQVLALTPSYCMVEEVERRVAWGIDHLPVKLIAITKDHNEVRA